MKKSIRIILSALLVLVMTVISLSAIEVSAASLDVMVNEFKSNRIDAPFIKGYDDGRFNPDGNMTRAEACQGKVYYQFYRC